MDLKHLYVNGTFLKQIARVGVPTGIQGMLFSFSNVLIQSSINSLGAVTMAASAATLNIGEFTYMSANSFYQTVLSFDAQNMGAKQYDRIDRINVLCIGYMLVVGGIMSVGTCCLGPQILGIFTTSSEVIEVGMKIMHWYILPFVLCGMMDVLSGCVRGMGFSVMPMVATLMGSCLMRVIWVLFIFPTNPTVSTLFLSYPITWILTGTTHFMCLLVVRKRIRRL